MLRLEGSATALRFGNVYVYQVAEAGLEQTPFYRAVLGREKKPNGLSHLEYLQQRLPKVMVNPRDMGIWVKQVGENFRVVIGTGNHSRIVRSAGNGKRASTQATVEQLLECPQKPLAQKPLLTAFDRTLQTFAKGVQFMFVSMGAN